MTTVEVRGRRRTLRRIAVGIAKWALLPLLAIVALGAVFVYAFPNAAKSAGGELLLRYFAFRSGTGWFEGGVESRQDIRVPMRDGVHLSTDLYLPSSPGRHPTIVVRTPYGKAEAKPFSEFFARYGYAVAVQDTRGRHKSEGEFYPFRYEGADGVDLTRWIKQQPWSDGKIGGFGASYLGFTQWGMAAGNPDVISVSPVFTTLNYHSPIYQGGAFSEYTFLHWSLSSYGRYGDGRGAANIKRGYGHFPLVESDDVSLRDIEFYNDWVRHPQRDDYWRDQGFDHRIGEIDAPAFLVAGWYDFCRDPMIRDFQRLRRAKILIGPWSHGFFNPHLKNYGIAPRKLELVPFEYVRETKQWFDYSLKGVSNGWDRRAAVRAFVMGDNTWRNEESWPPRGAAERAFYLHAGGKLTASQPATAEPDHTYVFDPANPVPSVGGTHGEAGPADQREVEKRKDVLVFSSEPLQQPLLAMGAAKVRLYASSSAPDTDFTGKLVDVFEDGRALIVCEGIIRARYRDGLDRPKPLEPGTVYPFEIDLGNLAVRFQKGHRIRLEISSSNAPRYDVNPNTGREIATERNPVSATQTILHRPGAGSALYLPVVADLISPQRRGGR